MAVADANYCFISFDIGAYLGAVRSRISSIENRQYFAEYFDSLKGSISWQNERI